jgi:hypothetical protein
MSFTCIFQDYVVLLTRDNPAAAIAEWYRLNVRIDDETVNSRTNIARFRIDGSKLVANTHYALKLIAKGPRLQSQPSKIRYFETSSGGT